MSTIQASNTWKQLPTARVVAVANQSGTFYNGQTNNGVGATFTYTTGALTIDGVTLVVNDRVLFAGQTSAYQNGIWQVTTAGATGVSAVLQRVGDMQCIEQIRVGQYVTISAGSVYAGSVWSIIEPLPAALGVPVTSGANNIVWEQVNGQNVVHGLYTNAGGSTSATIAVTNMTSSSMVLGTAINSSANASYIVKAVPGSAQFVVTFNTDPGASTIGYIVAL